MPKEIILTNNQMTALVDDDMYEILSKYKWHLNHNGYVRCNDNMMSRKMKTRRLHRIIHILKNSLNTLSQSIEIDHIDNNPLNNLTSNLRVSSRVDNSRNRRNNVGSLVEYKGVTYDKYRNKYLANITIDSKKIYIGSFDCKKEAAMEYNKMALLHFGQFAYLNEVN